MKIIITALMAIGLQEMAFNAQAAEEIRVKASAIGVDSILIGESGLQLGVSFKAVGILTITHPALGIQILVQEVDGKKLGTPVILKIRNAELAEKIKIGKTITLEGHEVANLRKIEIINQPDRSNVGNMGCTVELFIEKIVSIKE